MSGKIIPKVEDQAAPAAETKDQVRVSRTESGKGKPEARSAKTSWWPRKKWRSFSTTVWRRSKNVNPSCRSCSK